MLREKAAWSEENRRIHEDSIRALRDAGIFKLRMPTRFGGYEADTKTLVDVAIDLGRADGALAWTMSTYWIASWIVGLFPDEAQEEVFTTEDVRICGAVSPSGACVPVEGGYLLNGSWHFVSGALHSNWQELATILLRPGAEPEPVILAVPMSSLEIVDDWHTSGMAASGSVTTVAKDVFVPESHMIPLASAIRPNSMSKLNADGTIWRSPTILAGSAATVGILVGMAKAAREAFFEKMPGRPIRYTDYEHQAEAPVTHIQVGTAVMKTEQAEYHAYHAAALVDAKAASGEPWTIEERARVRADEGWATKLAKEAVEIFASASGGSSIYKHEPIQRIHRDLHAISVHPMFSPDSNTETYGRVLCGLEPNTMFI
ncbi:acyl-CoA dehydrogenase family protein [Kitasatospora paracochleata]|uniref:Alkylation response protein AidB-like acyl-CoA dehydrogenase n=1 Tax=Kitasatospora paracochleata TaxID=58354 RepID=A0ABT1IQ70_9ACTN|nr:acyl-CoA dehydrogenase family protein [Kitasatospora paracochleata]MCP2307108.1 alkylation response protein AidB-like acyl-CoA dehydrogenase [Kitasatospora paracochleata]